MDSSGELSSFLKDFIEPWYGSLKDPAHSQEDTLASLLAGYGQTQYGKDHGAEHINAVKDFQSSFPIANYASLQPYFEEVKKGNYSSILSEPATGWVMTRGTTGRPKVIPTTETHLGQILFVGARAIINFALKRDLQILQRNVLNLNFPSEVLTIDTEKGSQKFGYSSGTYAKLHPSLDAASLVPRQEEIDSLGGGISNADWERRFELVYNVAKTGDIGCVMGVTPVILAFARFMRRRYGLPPKEVWKMSALFCTSVSKIHSKYAPELTHYYGKAPIVEMYTATEGVFAQQLDENPYLVPNYDVYLFEVKTRSGVKLLHELKPNEWGSLIVSSVLFPRYEIGDLIESIGKGYYRVFGRAKTLTVLEHVFYNILAGRRVVS
ncbi:MAG TPA: GH3 auxin-responsive promoter family protein [Nitrososphaerales archaeon]|nr:GH3 auxin-responsive promoter family protein [Nitrososphaerales archaeon]